MRVDFPDTTFAAYRYDAAGRRIEKNLNATALRQYIDLEGQPLAQFTGTTLSYVHADHLGAPQKMTDAAGAVVWDAIYQPFGDSPAIAGTSDNPQRFPGQYFDSETGYHQNGFRDYDPRTGR